MPAGRSWRDGGGYEPPSLAAEGFVHCTGDDDLMLAVANRFYAGAGDLVVVTLDDARLTSEVRWEAPAHPDGGAPTAASRASRTCTGRSIATPWSGCAAGARSGDRFVGYEPMT